LSSARAIVQPSDAQEKAGGEVRRGLCISRHTGPVAR
jgi:hypothetical protein